MKKRQDNIVGLVGELIKLDMVKNICGLSFNGYLAKIETPRTSGVKDEVVVAFTDADVMNWAGKTEEMEMMVGARLLITGCQQTLKDFESGRILVFVLANCVAVSPNAIMQNDVALTGELAYEPKYRVTARGIRVADFFVKTQNMLTAGICYIPCICWHRKAQEVAEWKPGDKVTLMGRCQSRNYEKQIEGRREIRTAYEVSVYQIERTEGTGNVWLLRE